MSILNRRLGAVLFALAMLVSGAARSACAANDIAGELIRLNDNGAWSWFEDERAVVDVAGGKILVSSVAASAGTGGAARSGDVELASLDIASGNVTRFTLSNSLQADDHNSAAILIRPDGRYLAMYSKHGSDTLTRYRISTNPHDPTSWSPEQTFVNDRGATYSNLHQLSGEGGRIYNFTRTVGFNPNALVSDDDGQSWSYGGRLLDWPRPTGDPKFTGSDGGRPYVKYASNGVDEIHFITTEDHPRAYDNSIYHGVVRDGKVYDSFGNVVDGNLFDSSAAAPNDFTPAFDTDVSPLAHAWTTDLELDAVGKPFALFTARAGLGNTSDHRLLYARFNGSQWDVNEVAKLGGFLYSPENDYTGLGALDPHNPDRIFVSTKIDPRTDVPMPHYEIFEGRTDDGGASWEWAPITYNSTGDNLRPIVPRWDDEHTALLWMRGSYATYTDYNLDVVGLTAITPLVETSAADLNADGSVDVGDFTLYFTGLHADLNGLSPEEARMLGDLNGDLANNYEDFVLFKSAYDAARGAGSFVATLQVPEGAAMQAFVSGVGGLLFFRGLGINVPAPASGAQP